MGAVALFKSWPHIMGRVNERRRDSAEEKAGDWERLRQEIVRLHEQVACCERERAEWMDRAITAEATLQGYGEIRQLRAISDAAKRITGHSGPEGGGK